MAEKINDKNFNIIHLLTLLIVLVSILCYFDTVNNCIKPTTKININYEEIDWKIPRQEYQKLIDKQITSKSIKCYNEVIVNE